MFGQEYLDWCSEVRAGDAIDAFLAGMEPEDRKWALSVMRQRFEVRVEYRDSLGLALARNTNQQDYARQLAAQSHRPCGQSHFGGVVSTLARDLGL